MRDARKSSRNERPPPPDLAGNLCHIAPAWEKGTGQRLWLVSAPYAGTVLRFRGEPTSLLYAAAPLIASIKGAHGFAPIPGLSMKDVALLNPLVANDRLFEEVERRLRRQHLRALCVGNLTASSPSARKIAAIAKKVNPATVTIFGGPHEDDVSGKTAHDPRFVDIADFSISGDGELAFLELVRILFDYPEATGDRLKSLVERRADSFARCQGRGAVHFSLGGHARSLPLSNEPLVLKDLPRMPRELVHEADTQTFSVFKDGGRNVRTAQIMTHRGCGWRCSFCSESPRLNTRSVASVWEEIQEVRTLGYEALFFDDSTFTSLARARRQFLRELFVPLANSGLEWGCQTRLDQLDEDLLAEMKAAGCTYVFTGLESASEEMLRAMIKDQGFQHVERAFNAANRVGIRLGVSLIFGVADVGFCTTAETQETIETTLDFVEKQANHGNIVLVSPNLATYYPGTRMTGARTDLDFANPIVHRGYPWNRFEEGESYHPDGVTHDMATMIIEESLRRFGDYLVAQDLYSIDEYQESARARAPRGFVELNHASISRPPAQARAVAEHVAEYSRNPTMEERRACVEDARVAAARLFGLPDDMSSSVVLTRNATEAAGLTYWLARLHHCTSAKVLTTNAENASIPRAFAFHMDHGNPRGRDMWTSYQDFGAQGDVERVGGRQRTGAAVERVDVLTRLDAVEETILGRVTPDTSLVAFCHVIRDDGTICDVERLCREIRRVNEGVYILIDGAQALGALPSVDVRSLGCDFYIAAPHKTLGSLPLGLLYMSDRAKRNAQGLALFDHRQPPRTVVMDGMFAPELKVTPSKPETRLSLPEIGGFLAALKWLAGSELLNGADCTNLVAHRSELKQRFLDGLSRLPGVKVLSPMDGRHVSFIASFRFDGADNRSIVERLWRTHHVMVSYIGRTNVIRASFGSENGPTDVARAIEALDEARRAVEGDGRCHQDDERAPPQEERHAGPAAARQLRIVR